MGWIRHHGIVVTSTHDALIEKAHAMALTIFPWVSPVSPAAVNGTRSFFIPPDGSKELWEESKQGDARRDRFLEWIDSLAYEDGSSSVKWLEYEHDTDNGYARVTRAQGVSSGNGSEKQ